MIEIRQRVVVEYLLQLMSCSYTQLVATGSVVVGQAEMEFAPFVGAEFPAVVQRVFVGGLQLGY